MAPDRRCAAICAIAEHVLCSLKVPTRYTPGAKLCCDCRSTVHDRVRPAMIAAGLGQPAVPLAITSGIGVLVGSAV